MFISIFLHVLFKMSTGLQEKEIDDFTCILSFETLGRLADAIPYTSQISKFRF